MNFILFSLPIETISHCHITPFEAYSKLLKYILIEKFFFLNVLKNQNKCTPHESVELTKQKLNFSNNSFTNL